MLRRLLAGLSLAFLLTACGTEESAPPTPPPAATAGTLSGETVNGETVSLADFRGKPVFVNVWSSW